MVGFLKAEDAAFLLITIKRFQGEFCPPAGSFAECIEQKARAGILYSPCNKPEWERWGEKWEKTKPEETKQRTVKRRNVAACAEGSWQAREKGNELLNVVQRR